MRLKPMILFLLCTTLVLWTCGGGSTEPDTEPPAAPTGLAFDANQSGDGEIYLLWDSNEEADLQNYTVYRAEGAGTGTYLAIATVQTNAYLDAGLDYSVDYFYKITASDEDANESEFSSISGPIRPLNLNPPATPSAAAISAHNIQGLPDVELSWVGNTETDFHQYMIYRSDQSALFALDTNSFLDSTTAIFYLDYDVTAGTTYHYKIVAVDKGDLQSVATNVLSDTPLEEPVLVSPIDPSSPIASLVPEFSWNNVNGSHHFRIIVRSDLLSGDIWDTEVVSAGETTLGVTYSGTTLASNTRYYWLLEGYSQDGGEVNVYSETASFRTP